ncbi:HNH endonuclease signature motif containing protein [Mycobacterium sp. PSTR-4-N]|uniref:HNH endonuclease signature motif containing protein n=1 Tax=Mycobacterium sp. PSTR-4-N TaxID=2917745 RepID=UPI001F152CFA|nr:HNH endonuclease signature motif containing protein [Mycobacterium sp. PSTR-4-N]MCG7595895.1 HNH endonuclease [Mycobacterium sp. PSTR-4-N]
MFGSADAIDCVLAMGCSARAESRAIAERLAAVARLHALRTREHPGAEHWVVDVTEAVAAEVSAAQNISRSRAVSQVRMAVSLHSRLPGVAAVFSRGEIDLRMVRIVLNRTDNVESDVVAALDAVIAPKLIGWMRLSENKLKDRVDQWVATFDPAGVRVPPDFRDNLYFSVEPHVPGTAFAGGRLNALDAAALDKRLDALAATVCEADPRTAMQRRAAACGALGRGESTLACCCASPDCSAAALEASAARIVVHILAEEATVDGSSDAPGYLDGFGILPAEEVLNASAGAEVRPVRRPSDDAECGYRPSRQLAGFLHWRDLTCRFPGCDAPAQRCDVDHTTPWPAGATHTSNTKLYCRVHHLIKTFYTGANGWRDEQRPDGTVVLIAPTGLVYVTDPHGGQLFPSLLLSTGSLRDSESVPGTSNKIAMMPRRRATREQDRRDRVARERRQRLELDAELERQHQARLAETYEPPPF